MPGHAVLLLPTGQSIIGFARTEYTDDQFRQAMREACEKHARRPVEHEWAEGVVSVQHAHDPSLCPAAGHRRSFGRHLTDSCALARRSAVLRPHAKPVDDRDEE